MQPIYHGLIDCLLGHAIFHAAPFCVLCVRVCMFVFEPVRMCACLCVCVSVLERLRMIACVHLCVFEGVCVCLYVCVYVFERLRLCSCLCMSEHVRVCTCLYVCVFEGVRVFVYVLCCRGWSMIMQGHSKQDNRLPMVAAASLLMVK